MDDSIEVVVHKGRLVSKSTQWWWEHTKIAYDELYCAHDVKISEKCADCKKEASNEV